MLLVLVLVTTPTIPACRSKFSQKPPTPDLRRKIQTEAHEPVDPWVFFDPALAGTHWTCGCRR